MRLCDERGVGLALHGKTTMSPQFFQRELRLGVTFANAMQLRIGVAAGVRRALIANQVLQVVDLAAIADLQRVHPDLRVLFLLDSLQQLALIEATWPERPFEVLLEIGLPGGRTGCRDHDGPGRRDSRAVRLAGVELRGLAARGQRATRWSRRR
jgi:D-serine dehydratase